MILHADFLVDSMSRSLDFYVRGLGFTLADDAVLRGKLPRFLSHEHYDAMRLVLLKPSAIGPMVELVEFQKDSALRGAPFEPPPHHGSLAMVVKDLDAHIAALRKKDIAPASEIYDVPMPKANSRVIFYRDPDGHLLEFMEILKAEGRHRP